MIHDEMDRRMGLAVLRLSGALNNNKALNNNLVMQEIRNEEHDLAEASPRN